MAFQEHTNRTVERGATLHRAVVLYVGATLGLGVFGGLSAFLVTIGMTTCGCSMHIPPAIAAAHQAEPILLDVAVASAEGAGLPGALVRLTRQYGERFE